MTLFDSPQAKRCARCKENKPSFHFRKNSPEQAKRHGLLFSYCRPCVAALARARRAADPARTKRLAKAEVMRLRKLTFAAYGDMCVCCGEKRHEFLTIDHIYSDAASERRQHRIAAGNSTYRWLKRRGFPKDRYQLLCMNCNTSKHWFGMCPHELERQARMVLSA